MNKLSRVNTLQLKYVPATTVGPVPNEAIAPKTHLVPLASHCAEEEGYRPGKYLKKYDFQGSQSPAGEHTEHLKNNTQRLARTINQSRQIRQARRSEKYPSQSPIGGVFALNYQKVGDPAMAAGLTTSSVASTIATNSTPYQYREFVMTEAAPPPAFCFSKKRRVAEEPAEFRKFEAERSQKPSEQLRSQFQLRRTYPSQPEPSPVLRTEKQCKLKKSYVYQPKVQSDCESDVGCKSKPQVDFSESDSTSAKPRGYRKAVVSTFASMLEDRPERPRSQFQQQWKTLQMLKQKLNRIKQGEGPGRRTFQGEAKQRNSASPGWSVELSRIQQQLRVSIEHEVRRSGSPQFRRK